VTRIQARALWALILCISVTIVGFVALSGPVRTAEIALVLRILHFDASHLSAVRGHAIQALPKTGLAFRVQVTPYCSSLIAVLALGGIAGFILQGPLSRRMVAFAAAAALVVACNVVRIAASIWVGMRWGAGDLVLFHNWVGTLFALTYTLIGFLFMLYLMLPKHGETAQALEVA
jgi:carbamoyl-phosphate synthase large subunit